jgi:hypothetical protein
MNFAGDNREGYHGGEEIAGAISARYDLPQRRHNLA